MKNSMKFGVAAVAGAATLAGTVAPSHAYAYVPPAPTPVTNPAPSQAPTITTSTLRSYTAAPTITEPTAYAVTGVNYAAPMTDANWSTAYTPTQTYTDTTQTNLSTQATDVTPVDLPADSLKSAIVQTALQGEGSAYVWGGKTFGAWDCSGFVSWVFAQHGINLTSYTYAMKNELTPTSNPQPGDIVFTNGYSHVGIYLGNGQMISALNPAQGTIITSVDGGGYMPVDGYFTI